MLAQGDEEELLRLLAGSRIAERVEVDENGSRSFLASSTPGFSRSAVGQLGPAAAGSPKLNSSDFKMTDVSVRSSISCLNQP